MKLLLPILLWLLPAIAHGQAKDTVNKTPYYKTQALNNNQNLNSKTPYKPEILTSGFFDIVNNGQVNASARFIRLFIGEPGKFAIPLSIYSGVSTNNFSNGPLSGQNQQNQSLYRSNDQLVINFINPLSGLANISVECIIFLNRKKQRITKTGLIYHVGERILTGQKA
jgi:hypothetical protein